MYSMRTHVETVRRIVNRNKVSSDAVILWWAIRTAKTKSLMRKLFENSNDAIQNELINSTIVTPNARVPRRDMIL
jgi:hypothetical protein